MHGASAAIAVRKLRVSRVSGDMQALRGHLTRWLEACDARCPGLPAGAVLVLRRAQVSRATIALAPALGRERLEQLLLERARNARRPARGEALDDAEAVLFESESELLAWATQAALRGSQPWWLRALFPGGFEKRSLAALWTARPRAAACALEWLEQAQQASACLELFDAEQLEGLVRAITREHGLSALHTALFTARAEPARTGSPASTDVVRHQVWTEASVESKRSLLLAVARQLVSAPARLRDAAQVEVLLKTTSVSIAEVYRAEPARSSAAPTAAVSLGTSHLPDLGHANEATDQLDTKRPVQLQASEQSSESVEQSEPRAATTPRSTPTMAEHTATLDTPTTPQPRLAAREVETALGGLFYLLNLGLYLDIFADFTRPLWQPARGSGLEPWDFVAAFGRELAPRRCHQDPVWELLAELAGREPGEPLAPRFRPPREFLIEAAWLKPFAEETPLRWVARHGRLVVEHAAGFRVADLPLSGASAEQALGLVAHQLALPLDRFEPGRPANLPTLSLTMPRAGRWYLRRLLPYVVARLARALGQPAARAVPLTLRHAARVRLAPGRVDITYALAELPIQLRLAGLDRDPGWIPAAGRSVAFHFE